MIGTCSIDTTVTIWDLNNMTPKTQLIAHDKEVYDIAFLYNDVNIFATAGADGSVRLFDLRLLLLLLQYYLLHKCKRINK